MEEWHTAEEDRMVSTQETLWPPSGAIVDMIEEEAELVLVNTSLPMEILEHGVTILRHVNKVNKVAFLFHYLNLKDSFECRKCNTSIRCVRMKEC